MFHRSKTRHGLGYSAFLNQEVSTGSHNVRQLLMIHLKDLNCPFVRSARRWTIHLNVSGWSYVHALVASSSILVHLS